MMTPRIRIEKDFTVQWGIFLKTENGREKYNLEGKDLILRLQSAYKTDNLTGFSVKENVIEWTFYGKDQKTLGTYNLILVENLGQKGMATIDKIAAFTLVAHTEQESGNAQGDVTIQTIHAESETAIFGGGIGTVDEEFNSESKNAIANKTVTAAFAEVAEALSGKQDTISDLEAIREDAAKGATALQSVPAEYVTENELQGKGYATTAQVAEKQDIITDLEDIRSGAQKGKTAIQQVKTINGESLEGEGNIEIKVDLSEIEATIESTAAALADLDARVKQLPNADYVNEKAGVAEANAKTYTDNAIAQSIIGVLNTEV